MDYHQCGNMDCPHEGGYMDYYQCDNPSIIIIIVVVIVVVVVVISKGDILLSNFFNIPNKVI